MDALSTVDTTLFECPYFQVFKMPRLLVENRWSSYFEFIKDSINDDYYIRTSVNHKHVKNSLSYQSDDFFHPTMIYGYDKSNIYVADFFNKTYSTEKVSIDDVNNCLTPVDYRNYGNMLYDYIYDIYLCRFREYNYEFNIDEVINKLNDYLNSSDSFKIVEKCHLYNNRTFIFGVNCYDVFAKNIENNFIDIKTSHILYDHKLMMKIRLDYLLERKYINSIQFDELSEKLSDILERTLIYRNMIIKFNLKEYNDADIRKAKDMLSELKTLDKEFTIDLIDAIIHIS